MNISEIIVPLVSVLLSGIVTILVLLLNQNQENKAKKKEAMRECLDKFYSPFYKKCARHIFNDYSFMNASYEVKKSFANFFINNLEFANDKIQNLIYLYYLNATKLNQAIKLNNQELQDKTQKKLFTLFFEIMKESHNTQAIICKKLKLPKPSRWFLTEVSYEYEMSVKKGDYTNQA